MSTWHISCLHETYVMLTCIIRPNMIFLFMIMSTIIYHMSTCFNLHADINSWCQHACMAIMLPCTCAEVNMYATIILVQGSPSLSSEWHRDSARGAFPDTCYGCHKFYSTVHWACQSPFSFSANLLTIFIPSCVLPHRIVSQVFACQHVLHVMHVVHVAFYCEFYNLICYMSTFILYM